MPKYLDESGLTRFYDNISDRPVNAFDTVADMQSATYLEDGMTCHTNGFHTSGDGGAAYYTVSTSGTANGMDVLALQGGLFATLVIRKLARPEQFGARAGGTVDCTSAFNRCLAVTNTLILTQLYLVTGTIEVPERATIQGMSDATITTTATVLFNLAGRVTIKDIIAISDETANYFVRCTAGTNFSNFENIETKGFGTIYRFSTGSGVNFNTCVHRDFSVAGFESIDTSTVINDWYFSGCIFDAGENHTSAMCMKLDGKVEAVSCVNCEFLRGRYGVIFMSQNVRFNRFVNCYFDSSADAGMRGTGGSCYNTFSNCWFSSRNKAAQIDGASNNYVFDACHFICTGGIFINNTANNIHVTGCTFDGCSTTDTVVSTNCIAMGESTNTVIISNCTITNSFTDYSAQAFTAVVRCYTANVDYLTFVGNILANGVSLFTANQPTHLVNVGNTVKAA